MSAGNKNQEMLNNMISEQVTKTVTPMFEALLSKLQGQSMQVETIEEKPVATNKSKTEPKAESKPVARKAKQEKPAWVENWRTGTFENPKAAGDMLYLSPEGNMAVCIWPYEVLDKKTNEYRASKCHIMLVKMPHGIIASQVPITSYERAVTGK